VGRLPGQVVRCRSTSVLQRAKGSCELTHHHTFLTPMASDPGPATVQLPPGLVNPGSTMSEMDCEGHVPIDSGLGAKPKPQNVFKDYYSPWVSPGSQPTPTEGALTVVGGFISHPTKENVPSGGKAVNATEGSVPSTSTPLEHDSAEMDAGEWITVGGSMHPAGKSKPAGGHPPPVAAVKTAVGLKKTTSGPLPSVGSAGLNGPLASWLDPDASDKNSDSRYLRTCTVTLPPRGGAYTRAIFLEHLRSTGCLAALEACGPTSAPHVWQFTFKSETEKRKFQDRGDFVTSTGLEARLVKPKPKAAYNRHNIRVHWVPYHVPMDVIKKRIEACNVKVVSAKYETANVEGFEAVKSLVRSLVVETTNPQNIPYTFKWSFKGQYGVGLVTIKGRAPYCMKCQSPGHRSGECKAPKCTKCSKVGHIASACNTHALNFAAAVSGQPGGFSPAAADGMHNDVLPEDEIETGPIITSAPLTSVPVSEISAPITENPAPTVHENISMAIAAVEITPGGDLHATAGADGHVAVDPVAACAAAKAAGGEGPSGDVTDVTLKVKSAVDKTAVLPTVSVHAVHAQKPQLKGKPVEFNDSFTESCLASGTDYSQCSEDLNNEDAFSDCASEFMEEELGTQLKEHSATCSTPINLTKTAFKRAASVSPAGSGVSTSSKAARRKEKRIRKKQNERSLKQLLESGFLK
jgi:hypothetical protein